MEKKIEFASDGLMLEGLLSLNSTEKAAIITHPHPLYGGEMHNAVVSTVAAAYAELGYSTLRFNFRGTGYSEGTHDDGKGERQDVLSAISWLKESGFSHITLSGYSFGAWVNLMVAADSPEIQDLVLVSPPVDFIRFDPVKDISALNLVVVGTHDEYASSARISELIEDWNRHADMEEIPGCDHFYSGNLGRLKEIIISYSS